MVSSLSTIEERALDWFIRQRDPVFADWEEFADWLDEDPRHREAYDRIAIADRNMVDLLASRAPYPQQAEAPPPRAGHHGLFLWGGVAAAAALAATGLYFAIIPPTALPYIVETDPGARRAVTLADGSRIELNGDTRVALDRRNPRIARLESGEATFTVTHDPERPFTVTAGDGTIRDVGTAFNVVRANGATDIAVAEGAVRLERADQAIDLTAGMRVHAVDGVPSPKIERTDPADIGGWRSGRLVYASAPLSTVAADLSRNLGVPVTVEPSIATRPFGGTILIDRDTQRLFGRLEGLLDVKVRREGNGWVFVSAGHAAR